MKSFFIIMACVYWIMFFVAEPGVYGEYIFQLVVAIGLTIFLLLWDLKDYKEEIKK